MLRLAVMVAASVFVVIAVAAVFSDPGAWPMLIVASVFLLGTVGERFHYAGQEVAGPDGPWEPTSERFLDEESGKLVTVWYNAATGERRYIEAE
jgi:hypothetical protein